MQMFFGFTQFSSRPSNLKDNWEKSGLKIKLNNPDHIIDEPRPLPLKYLYG